MAGPCFVGALFARKGYKIANTKSGIKVNINLGHLPEPWMGPEALRLKRH